ncbi:MAG: hypothetical protein KBT57_10885 [bacterium]|nr:hypothetical protein [Candidatus Limimorpha equi]
MKKRYVCLVIGHVKNLISRPLIEEVVFQCHASFINVNKSVVKETICALGLEAKLLKNEKNMSNLVYSRSPDSNGLQESQH